MIAVQHKNNKKIHQGLITKIGTINAWTMHVQGGQIWLQCKHNKKNKSHTCKVTVGNNETKKKLYIRNDGMMHYWQWYVNGLCIWRRLVMRDQGVQSWWQELAMDLKGQRGDTPSVRKNSSKSEGHCMTCCQWDQEPKKWCWIDHPAKN